MTGNFDENYVDFSLADFKRVEVAAKENPDSLYDKEVLEINQDMALVVAKVLAGDQYCSDYISLLQIDGQWKIRHQCFTNPLWS